MKIVTDLSVSLVCFEKSVSICCSSGCNKPEDEFNSVRYPAESKNNRENKTWNVLVFNQQGVVYFIYSAYFYLINISDCRLAFIFILFNNNALTEDESSSVREFYKKEKTATAAERTGPGSMIYAAIAVCGYFYYSACWFIAVSFCARLSVTLTLTIYKGRISKTCRSRLYNKNVNCVPRNFTFSAAFNLKSGLSRMLERKKN